MTIMKTKNFFICLSFVLTLLALPANAVNIRSLFVEMPDSVIPYLSKNNRLDFLDFIDSNMKAEVRNEFGGKSIMTALTDDSLSIILNDACKIDLLLLNTTEMIDSCQQVLCMVKTVGVSDDHRECTFTYFSLRWHVCEVTPNLVASDKQRVSVLNKKSNILNKIKEKLNKP